MGSREKTRARHRRFSGHLGFRASPADPAGGDPPTLRTRVKTRLRTVLLDIPVSRAAASLAPRRSGRPLTRQSTRRVGDGRGRITPRREWRAVAFFSASFRVASGGTPYDAGVVRRLLLAIACLVSGCAHECEDAERRRDLSGEEELAFGDIVIE